MPILGQAPSASATPLSCQTISADSSVVDKAFQDLSRDMNPEFSHVFLDKLQRYAAKPDRALFLAEYQGRFIAFATIISHSPAPDKSDKRTIQRLQKYACGTGLMVLQEFRHKGVASKLIQCWENWALQNSLDGIWVVTHRMSDWYQYYFQYSVHGTTIHHGVEKTILTKILK